VIESLWLFLISKLQNFLITPRGSFQSTKDWSKPNQTATKLWLTT